MLLLRIGELWGAFPEFLRRTALIEVLRRCELRRSAPRRHVRKIADDQIDLAAGHLVRRKSGHLQAGPNGQPGAAFAQEMHEEPSPMLTTQAGQ
jgi:hypothetical protein